MCFVVAGRSGSFSHSFISTDAIIGLLECETGFSRPRLGRHVLFGARRHAVVTFACRAVGDGEYVLLALFNFLFEVSYCCFIDAQVRDVLGALKASSDGSVNGLYRVLSMKAKALS